MAEWRITSVSTDIYSFSGATAHWFKKMPQKELYSFIVFIFYVTSGQVTGAELKSCSIQGEAGMEKAGVF